jgi:hypothetical protein
LVIKHSESVIRRVGVLQHYSKEELAYHIDRKHDL